MNNHYVLDILGLEKTFVQGERRLTIFRNLNLHVQPGEIVGLVGQSGSGKTTLLQIAGLLDRPTAGQVSIKGRATQNMKDRERTQLRLDTIGFVYQFHHLLPEFSALENVAMPLVIAGKKKAQAHEKAAALLDDLGLAKRVDHRPAQLSGGEQQRVAIARALANDPKLLLADEPTGNLDPGISGEVFDLLMRQVKERGIGALVATHNHMLAAQMTRALELKNGQIVSF